LSEVVASSANTTELTWYEYDLQRRLSHIKYDRVRLDKNMTGGGGSVMVAAGSNQALPSPALDKA